jgi:hypothetical protein
LTTCRSVEMESVHSVRTTVMEWFLNSENLLDRVRVGKMGGG